MFQYYYLNYSSVSILFKNQQRHNLLSEALRKVVKLMAILYVI